jgi:hypothetical protein
MHFLEEFDPSTKFYCSIEGDTPPGASGGAGSAPPPAGGEGAPPPDPAASAAPEGTPPAPRDWRDKQIDKHYATIKLQERELDRLKALEAENAQLKALNDAATRRSGDTPPPPPAAPQPASAQASDAVIAQRVEQELFNRQVKDLESKVRQDYPNDLQPVLENLNKLGLSGDTLAGVMSQVLATDDPAYVLVTLGKDPGRLQDTLDMTPAKRQAAMIKIGMERAAAAPPTPDRPSGAPPPPSAPPTRGSAAAPSSDNIYDPALTDEQFYAIRKRQKLESEGRLWSIKGR